MPQRSWTTPLSDKHHSLVTLSVTTMESHHHNVCTRTWLTYSLWSILSHRYQHGNRGFASTPKRDPPAASILPLTPDSTEWREALGFTGGGGGSAVWCLLIEASRQLARDARIHKNALAILFNDEWQWPPPPHSVQYWVKGSWGVNVWIVKLVKTPRQIQLRVHEIFKGCIPRGFVVLDSLMLVNVRKRYKNTCKEF